MKTQEILDKVTKSGTPMNAAEVRKILDTLRSEAEAELQNLLVGVLVYHRAQTLAKELAVTIDDAEATAQTMGMRVNGLQQQVDAADLASRRAKADKIMLPGNAPKADVDKADRAIADAERALRTAEGNLQIAKTTAAQRHRELNDLRAVHRALETVSPPDTAAVRALLSALK